MTNPMSILRKDFTDTAGGIKPLNAPAIYSDHFNKHKDTIITMGRDGNILNLEMLSTLNDARSGFRADVMLDKATGHAVILYKGMDVPFKDEGNGRLAFLSDAFTAAQSMISGGKNWQTKFADQIYQETISNPDVKSVEAIGFSLGSLHANFIAAKYGIRATVLSDLGIADRGLESIFNESSGITVDHAKQSLKENVTVLEMCLDLIPKLFGAGSSKGTVIDLDSGKMPNLSGLTHQAEIYSQKATILGNNPLPRPA